jgi:hypothetical protein
MATAAMREWPDQPALTRVVALPEFSETTRRVSVVESARTKRAETAS